MQPDASPVSAVRRFCLLAFLSTAALVLEPVAWISSAHAQQLTPDERAAVLLTTARAAFNDGNYPFAAEKFREFIQQFGAHPQVHSARFGLGAALVQGVGDYQAAIEPLTHAAAQAFDDQPQAIYFLALAHRGLGQRELREAAAKPNEAPQRRQAANGHFERALAQFTLAGTAFTQKVKGPPAPDAKELPEEIEWGARVRCDQAEMLLELGKPAEAAPFVEAFVADATLTKSKYRPLGLYYTGQAAFLTRHYNDAGRALSQLAPFADPSFGAHARYLLARTHHLAEERAEAAALYDAVLKGYDAAKQAAQQALQNPQLAQRNPAEKARLEAFIAAAPDYVSRAAFYAGVLVAEEGRFGDAAGKLAAFAQQYPQSPLLPEAALRLGMCQVKLKQFAEAPKALGPLEAHPVLGDQAMLWLARAELGAADPANPQGYAQQLKNAQDRLRRAADKANVVANADPDAKLRRVECLLELAAALEKSRQFADAANVTMQVFNENQDPDRREEALARTAAAQHLAGQFPQSDDTCRRFVGEFPQSPLTASVLFRYGENAFLTAQAAFARPDLPNRDAELARLYDEAITRYQTVIEKFPEAQEGQLARQGLGISLFQRGKYEEAATTLAAIPDGARTGELADVPYLLANCLVQTLPTSADDALSAGRLLDQSSQAVKLLDGFIASQPNSPSLGDALLKLGYCHQAAALLITEPAEKNKVLALARQAYEKLLPLANHPARPTAIFERAKVIAAMGDVQAAMNELGQFTVEPLRTSAIAPLACVRYATMLRAQNKAADAVNVLGGCRQVQEANLLKDPTKVGWAALLQYHQGLALADSGKLPEARQVLENVPRQFAQRAEGAEGAVAAVRVRKQQALARIATARALAAKPDAKPEERDASAKEIAAGWQDLRDTAQYSQDLGNQFANTPVRGLEPHLRLYYEAAWCLRAVGDAEIAAARQKLADEARAKPDSKIRHANDVPLASVPVQPAEQKAREQYVAFIALASTPALGADGRLELAEMHAWRGEHDRAIELLVEALDQDSEGPAAHAVRLRLGTCLLAKQSLDKALAQFQAVAADAKSPLAPEGRIRAAECLLEQKKAPEAVAQLVPFRDQQPLQNLPGVSDRGLLRLGQALAIAGQWDQSRQANETLVGRFPNSPWLHEARYGIGWAWQNQNQFDHAVNTYNQVVAGTTAEAAARAQLQIGVCRLAQKRFGEAASALLVVPYTYDYPELCAAALVEASQAMREQQQPAQAAALLQRVLKDYPNSPHAAVAKQKLEGK